MATSGLASLAGLISERLAQLESSLNAAASSGHTQSTEKVPPVESGSKPLQERADVVDNVAALTLVRDLQRQLDRVLFLQNCASLFASPLALPALITQLMDEVWQRNQLTFAALVLGESELGR